MKDKNCYGFSSRKKIIRKKYRDYRDLCASILETLSPPNNQGIGTGVGITHLMYRTVVSYKDLCRRLDYLIEKGLISKKTIPGKISGSSRPDHDVFFITPKGARFLYLYTELIKRYLLSPACTSTHYPQHNNLSEYHQRRVINVQS